MKNLLKEIEKNKCEVYTNPSGVVMIIRDLIPPIARVCLITNEDIKLKTADWENLQVFIDKGKFVKSYSEIGAN